GDMAILDGDRLAGGKTRDDRVIHFVKPPQRQPAAIQFRARLLVRSFGVDGERVVAVADGQRRAEEQVRRDEPAVAGLMDPPWLVPVGRMCLSERASLVGQSEKAQFLRAAEVLVGISEAEPLQRDVAPFWEEPVTALPVD